MPPARKLEGMARVDWPPPNSNLAQALSRSRIRTAASRLAARVWRGRALVFLMVLLGLLAGLAGFSVMERRSTAEVTIRLDALPQARAAVWREARILRSRNMARQVVEALGPSEAWVASPLAEPATQEVQAHLSVRADAEAGLITIAYSGRSPEQATRIVRTFAAQYLQLRTPQQGHPQIRSVAEPGLIRVAAAPTASAGLPLLPERPRSLILLTLGSGSGLLVGLLLAAFRREAKRGFTTAVELTSITGLRCLGALPQRSRKAGSAGCRAVFDAEICDIAGHLGLFDSSAKGRVVLVTSALPREGKSTLCQALAEALLAAGQRVLLLDEDATGTCSPPRAGETYASLEDTIRPAVFPCLVVVPDRPQFGARVDAESAGEFVQFLEDARLHFDLILLAGAPVMRSADPLILGRMSDLILMVTRWGTTPRDVVEAALARLEAHSLAIEAVVLNKVDPSRHAAVTRRHPLPSSPHRATLP